MQYVSDNYYLSEVKLTNIFKLNEVLIMKMIV